MSFWSMMCSIPAARCALAWMPLFRQGRPRKVQLCVLIDRGHRELPVEASFVGRKVQTTDQEIIKVQLREIDGRGQSC